MQPRRWWPYIVGGAVALAWVGLLSLIAVLISARFVIFYARYGPVPGQRVVRPVVDFVRPTLHQAGPQQAPEEGGEPPP